jgi:membrane protein
MSELRSTLQKGQNFIHKNLWNVDLRPLSRFKTVIISILRIIGVVIRDFIDNKSAMQAGTLTYLTLLALVPVLALMFSITKGLGVQERLMENIGLKTVSHAVSDTTGEFNNGLMSDISIEIIEDSGLAQWPKQYRDIVITVFTVVEKTNVRTLGAIGLIFLVWTVIRVIGKVEKSFNHIWNVKKPRHLTRRFLDYISIVIVVPFLILIASSINAFLSSERMLELMQNYFGSLAQVYELTIRWTMLGFVILAFLFLMKFLPNTRVRFIPALIGGLFTALTWFVLQIFYFKIQSGVTMYNVIYGTFAALPFFLIWLHTSWMIVLFGAELTYAVQNHRVYRLEQKESMSNLASLSALGFSIMFEITGQYKKNEGLWSVDSYTSRHHISKRLTDKVLHVLQDKELVTELADQPGKYVLTGDPSYITLADIEDAFRDTLNPVIMEVLSESSPVLVKWVQRYQEHLKSGVACQTLSDLIHSDMEEPNAGKS